MTTTINDTNTTTTPLAWDAAQVAATFKRQGVCFIKQIFSNEQLQNMHDEIARLMNADVPGTVFEKDNQTVRAMHGCHLHSEVFASMVRHPALLAMVENILGSKVYLHQFKINFKRAFTGAKWDWHQDFVFWQREDGLPEPRLVNMIVALDEINEFNGPLFLVAQSHQQGALDESNGMVVHQPNSENNWQDGFGEKLKYTVAHDKVKALVDDNALLLGKCQRGDIMLFDSNIVHASSPNISPFQRKMLILSYNCVDNRSTFAQAQRPEYISGRDCRPLTPDLNQLTGDIASSAIEEEISHV